MATISTSFKGTDERASEIHIKTSQTLLFLMVPPPQTHLSFIKTLFFLPFEGTDTPESLLPGVWMTGNDHPHLPLPDHPSPVPKGVKEGISFHFIESYAFLSMFLFILFPLHTVAIHVPWRNSEWVRVVKCTKYQL